MRHFTLMTFLVLISLCGFAQSVTVTGKVTDADYVPIPGATVLVKGTSIGTITENDGQFTLKTNKPNDILVFSFLGMRTKEVDLNGKIKLNIQLESMASELEDVVVVGYGTQKKESVVAAISTISSDEIVQSPTSSLSVGLAGKMPGLSIMLKDGEIGSENIDIYIRGQATLNATTPLVLVDGSERDINSIDPNDVESISILKDASATAVYGVRGANGVILVTTKKGVLGKPKITATFNYTLQTPTRLPEPLGAIDYMTIRNEVVALDNPDNKVPYPQEVFDHYKNGYLPEYYVDRDWYGEFMHKYVAMKKGNVNIQGGTDKAKYYVSLGYLQQGGPFKTERWDEYDYDNEQRVDRFTYRANIDLKLTNTLSAWLKLSGSLQDKNDPIIRGDQNSAASGDSWYYSLLSNFTDIPSISEPNTDPDGNVVSLIYGKLNRSGYRISTDNSINSSLGLSQDLKFITPGLSLNTSMTYDTKASHIRGFRRTFAQFSNELVQTSTGQDSIIYIPGGSEDGELIRVLTQSFSNRYDFETSLNYKRRFGKNDFSGLLLYKQNKRIVNNNVPYNYLNYVSRVTYAYNNRYLAEANFGMNGSEQFAPGKRYGFFPSISVGWIASEETFLKESAVEFLKLRASFGQVGNDRISNARFLYLDNWTQNSSGYFDGLGGIPGLSAPVYEETIPNINVTWEVANKSNFGIESEFSNGITFDLDLFYEKRSSILISEAAVPALMFGQLELPPVNNGVMTNRGFEFILGHRKKFDNKFSMFNRASFSFARNRIENADEAPLPGDFVYPYRVEGFSRGVKFGYENLGYFESMEEINGWADQSTLGGEVLPGDLKYKDQNGDNVIDEMDKVKMTYPNTPEINFSYTLNLNYKGIDLSVLMQGVSNYTFDFSGRAIWDWDGTEFNGLKNYFELHKYAWTPEKVANGEEIKYPRMHIDGTSCSKVPNDYWLIDLWYLRMKNVELGYTFPKSICKSIGLGRLRVYANALNVFTIDNMPFKYLDPEVKNSLSHPVSSNYNIGVEIGF